MYHLNEITGVIVDSAVRIHAKIGPGLLESVYESILSRDLAQRGFDVQRQKHISFEYEGLLFENACRCDLLVQRSVVVEVKSASKIIAVHEQQLLTYLRLLDCRVGLILNFGAPIMKHETRAGASTYPLWVSASPRPSTVPRARTTRSARIPCERTVRPCR